MQQVFLLLLMILKFLSNTNIFITKPIVLQEIVNSFIRFGDKRLNNGYLEGINNRIKVIKKISYGCKNFNYFRNRIMYAINENEPISNI